MLTHEERQRIIGEAHATLRRVDAMHDDHASPFDVSTRDDAVNVEPRVETRNERHRREIDEQEQRFARERARRDNRLDTPPITVADVETLIAAALTAERATVVPALRSCIDELLDQEREHVKSTMTEQMRSLELQVAKLESALTALQCVLAGGKAADLTPLRAMN